MMGAGPAPGYFSAQQLVFVFGQKRFEFFDGGLEAVVRIGARGIFVAAAVEVFAANSLHVEVAFGAKAQFHDGGLVVNEGGQFDVADAEQVVYDAFGVAPLDVELFVVFFRQPDHSRAVFGPVFHAVAEAMPEQAQVFFLVGVENHVLHGRVVEPAFHQISDNAEDARVGGVAERAGVGDDAGIQAFADDRVDLDAVAQATDEAVHQFAGAAGVGLGEHVIGDGLGVEVVVDQDAFAGQRTDEVAHFIDAAVRVEIEENEEVFLLQNVFALLGVDVPDQNVGGAGQYVKLFRVFRRKKHVHRMAVLFQVMLHGQTTADGVAVGVAVRTQRYVLGNRDELLQFGCKFHRRAWADCPYRQEGAKVRLFPPYMLGCSILFLLKGLF